MALTAAKNVVHKTVTVCNVTTRGGAIAFGALAIPIGLIGGTALFILSIVALKGGISHATFSKTVLGLGAGGFGLAGLGVIACITGLPIGNAFDKEEYHTNRAGLIAKICLISIFVAPLGAVAGTYGLFGGLGLARIMSIRALAGSILAMHFAGAGIIGVGALVIAAVPCGIGGMFALSSPLAHKKRAKIGEEGEGPDKI